jgi:hypothetical protein
MRVKKDVLRLMPKVESIKRNASSYGVYFAQQVAKINGADTCRASVSDMNLMWSIDYLVRDFGWPGKVIAWIFKYVFNMPGIMGPSDSTIKDNVYVVLTKKGAPAYGTQILGKGLRFPDITVCSRAKPCWLGISFQGWHNPESDDTGWFECMMEPFPTWTSKLTHR